MFHNTLQKMMEGTQMDLRALSHRGKRRMIKWISCMMALITTIPFLSGCLSPNGLLVSDQLTAEEYMTNNPQLIEKYGKIIRLRCYAEVAEETVTGKALLVK
jgi:hypothetical protein